MKTKPAFLILALSLIAAPLFPGTALADGGKRDWASSPRWHHEGRHDHGRRGHERDWDRHRYHGHHHHGSDRRWEPRIVYRDLPDRYRSSRNGLTIIYNGSWR